MSETELELSINGFLKDCETLYNIGMYKEIVQLCREFLDSTVDDRVYSMLSSAEFALGDNLSSEKSARKGLKLKPDNPDLLYNLACILQSKGILSNALRYYVRAAKAGDKELSDICRDEIVKLEGILSKSEHELIPNKAKKRVLIIAVVYPPLSGSGVQRTVKLVKYLRFYGWEPVVVTVTKEKKSSLLGDEYFDELPDDIEVIRIPIEECTTSSDFDYIMDIYSTMLSDKMHDFLLHCYESVGFEQKRVICSFPEPLVLWACRLADNLCKYIDINDIDVVYSTSGPYSDHFAGYHIKRLYKIPWVADFRDDWSDNPSLWKNNKEDLSYRLCIECEQAIFNTADHIVCVTERSKENYLKLGLPEDKVSCITNGYDDEDFEWFVGNSAKNEKFTIVHNGLMYPGRTTETVLKAIRNLLDRKKIDANKIDFHMGYVNKDESTGLDLGELIKNLNLEQIAILDPHMEHHDSIVLAASADLLLLILGASADFASTYPGKIFEYFRLGKPILSLGPIGSISESLLSKSGRGTNVDYSDIDSIEKEILRSYNANDTVLTDNAFDFTMYERKRLAGQHAEIFDKVSVGSF